MVRITLYLLLGCLLGGCATLSTGSHLPILLQSEDLAGRAYERIGTIQVSRERYGVDLVTDDDHLWARQALQEEARRMSADAVTWPELTVSSESYLLFPVVQVKARSTAIRFR